jgi:hypothetical protein
MPSARRSVLILFLIASPALAQLNRSAVSVSGSDTNSCAVNSPCRSFAAAFAQTNSGGEIIALDSGGYGTLTINKSVKVVAAPGVYAGITVPGGGNGIYVAAGASDKITIRGVIINSLTSSTAIYLYSGGSVFIENVTTDTAGGNGIVQASVGSLSVADSLIRNCYNGVVSNPLTPGTMTTINGVTVVNNSNGAFAAFNGARMTVRDSVAFEGHTGFSASAFTHPTEINVENCAAFNQYVAGASTADHGTARISNSVITDNARGLWVAAGAIETFGNNEIRGNSGNDFVGMPTTVPLN